MITRYLELGYVEIRVDIGDNIAVLKTNNPQITKQMYEGAKRAGKNVFWDERQYAMVETFSGLKAEQIASMIDTDFTTAKQEKVKAEQYARDERSKEKK
jgi:hypothetical protein